MWMFAEFLTFLPNTHGKQHCCLSFSIPDLRLRLGLPVACIFEIWWEIFSCVPNQNASTSLSSSLWLATVGTDGRLEFILQKPRNMRNSLRTTTLQDPQANWKLTGFLNSGIQNVNFKNNLRWSGKPLKHFSYFCNWFTHQNQSRVVCIS